MIYLTKEQFKEEVLHQIYQSVALDEMIQAENYGRNLKSFHIKDFVIWHTWKFPDSSNQGLVTDDTDKKWINTGHNIKYQPTAQTSFENLLLAGAHVRNSTDLYSMEGAAESGRRAADLIHSTKTVIQQSRPFNILQTADSFLFKLGMPHIFKVMIGLSLVLAGSQLFR